LLYICIPAYDEAPTVGLLLWRIRKVFQDYPREYEILVFNDGSTDATSETLQAYTEVLPLTIMGTPEHVGYARALDVLCREVSRRTRYPRRDAMIVMQADFTDQPEHLPELIKRFEGGADLVVAERPPVADKDSPPKPVRWMRRVAPWILRPFVSVSGVSDPFGTFRLYRITRRPGRPGYGVGRQRRSPRAHCSLRASHRDGRSPATVRPAPTRKPHSSMGRCR